MAWQLLLHCDGTNGGSVFTDSSPQNRTVTANPGTTTNTGTKVFGTASAFMAYQSTLMWVAGTENFNWGAGEWTVDFRYYCRTISNPQFPVSLSAWYGDATKGGMYVRSYNNVTTVHVVCSDNVDRTCDIAWATYGIATDVWHHLAIGRDGDTVRTFINGTEGPSISLPAGAQILGSNTVWAFGGNAGASSQAWMLLDEISIRTGVFVDFSVTGVPSAAYDGLSTEYGEGTGELQALGGSAVYSVVRGDGSLKEIIGRAGPLTHDGYGPLGEITGAAELFSTLTRMGTGVGPTSELSGDCVAKSGSASNGLGFVKALRGAAATAHRGVGALASLIGAAISQRQLVNAGAGRLREIFGLAGGYTVTGAVAAGSLGGISGLAVGKMSNTANAWWQLGALAGMAASGSLAIAGSGSAQPLSGTAECSGSIVFGEMKYVKWTVRK